MADRDIQIGIKTTADTSGAKAATIEIAKLNAATGTAADKAKVLQWAHYDLDATFKKTEKSAGKMASAAGDGGKNMGKMGMLANQASFQIGDFFTQVEMGTSAVRAFSQQAPQLMGAFTMAGVLSGPVTLALAGIAAAIPIITVGVKALSSAFSESSEPAGKTAEAIGKIKENMGALKRDEIDKVTEGIYDARDAAIDLRQDISDITAAENELANATLSNAEKRASAHRNIALLLDLEIDKLDEIRKAEEEAAEKRRVAAEQALAAEQKKLDDARFAAQVAADTLTELQFQDARNQADLIRQRERLKLLREEKAELERIAALDLRPGESGSWSPAGRMGPDPRSLAKKELGTARFTTEMGGIENVIAELEKTISGVAKADRAFQKASNTLSVVEGAVALNIQRIEETFAEDDLLAKTEVAVNVAKAMAEEVRSVTGKIEANTAQAAANKATLDSAAADGAVTTRDLANVSQGLKTMVGSLQSGTATSKENVQELIRIVTRLQADVDAQKAQIKSLANGGRR